MFCKINLKTLSATVTGAEQLTRGKTTLIAKGRYWHKRTNGTLSVERLRSALRDFSDSAFSQIRGNYIIIMINAEKKSLKIATDKIGSVPLYYRTDGSRIELSDNIDNLPRYALNANAVNKYFENGLIPPPETVYKDIFKLNPGIYTLNRSTGTLVKKKYDFSEKPILAECLRRIPLNVKNYSQGNTTVLLTTGGLDSSFLAAAIKKLNPHMLFAALQHEQTRQYNIRSAKDCREIAAIFKLPFQIIKIDARSFLRSAPKIAGLIDEPVKDYDDIPAVYSLFEQISRRFPSACVVSGIGVNEMFGLSKNDLIKYLNDKLPPEINLHKRIAGHFGLEFYVPFLTEELISFSINTPLIKRKDKMPLKKEIAKMRLLPEKYTAKAPEHSEIPGSFLSLLEKMYDGKRSAPVNRFFLKSGNFPKIKKDFFFRLWINRKYRIACGTK